MELMIVHGTDVLSYAVTHGDTEKECLDIFTSRHPDEIIVEYGPVDWDFIHSLPAYSEEM